MSEKHPQPVNTGLTLDEEVVGGRYQIIRLVARGGMAEVYLANHVQLDRSVALKVLKPPDGAEDVGSFEDRFRLEAQTLAGLDHPNIVTLHDFGELEDGRFFLAMEFIDGPRLTDLVKVEPLEPERAIRLMLQVCSALRYAHKRGVIHRDLKPSNLLLRINEEEGTELVKVVDFGLVKLTEQDQSLTRAGLILGSPHCMAPEQVKGIGVDHRADIYAVGVLLFRTITGRYPFHGTNSTATMIAHLNQPVPKMREINPQVSFPPGTEAVIRKCLEKSPAARFDDMPQLMAALAGLLDLPPDQYASLAMTHSSIQREFSPSPMRARAPRWPFVLAAAGVLLTLIGVLAIAGGVLIATSSRSTAPNSVDHSIEGTATGTPEATPPVTEPSEPEAATPPTGSSEAAPESAPNTTGAGDTPKPSGDGAGSAEPTASKPPPLSSGPATGSGTAPVKPKPTEVETPSEPEAKKPEPKEDAPDGYMGVPDDLFE